ncbi:MAG: LysM peptidoglycan-binding domain-containing protein [Ferruginibacter sp.]
MKVLLIALFSFPLCIMAQTKPVIAQGVYPALYVTHTAGPKENYYSIGRIYNISPKEIAPFNNLEMEKGLSLNQTIKIPLSQSNFLQEGNAAEDEVLIPVYHTVEGKEGLYRISVNFNKLPVETIVKWNNLKSPTVSNGTNLIIGYLKVKKDLSSLAGMATTKPVDNIAKPDSPKAPVNTDNTAKTTEKPAEKPVQSPVVTAKPTAPTVKEQEPAMEPVKKTPDPIVVKEKEPVKATNAQYTRKNFNGGVFKSDYDKQIKSKQSTDEKGEAAIFKSTSGWEDGKYYCLHNGSTPGTIIKITNNTTGKNIYAKVLDVIPDMQQNSGLLIRLSNAGADELGAGESTFDCTLSYPK